jgi:hypothetical protein
VKKLHKIAAVVNIFILFCLVLGINSRNSFEPQEASKQPVESTFSSSVVSHNWFCDNPQSASLVQVIVHSAQTSLKNSFNQFSACPVAAGKLLFNKYLPYIYCSRSLVLGLKTTDIIFPFHYFW